MGIRFDQVNIVSPDVDASIAFYRLLGIEIADTDDPYASHHRSLPRSEPVAVDLDSLAFARSYWAEEGIPTGPMLSFRVDAREEVDVFYERMTTAGYRGLKAPFDAFWGARLAIVLDPSGAAVGIMSAVAPERRQPPLDPTTFR